MNRSQVERALDGHADDLRKLQRNNDIIIAILFRRGVRGFLRRIKRLVTGL